MADKTADELVLLALLKIVNDADKLPAQAELDHLDATCPSASVQQLDGTRIAEPYVDGSGIGELPFAVLLRVNPNDSAGRVNAAASLMALSHELEVVALPDGWVELSGVSTPVLVERGDNYEIWRAAYVLERDVAPTRRARIDA